MRLPEASLSPLDVELAHDVPLYQYENSLLAIASMSPTRSIDDIDVLTSQLALEKLFNFVAGRANEDFCLHLFLVGGTMIIEDRSAQYDTQPVTDLFAHGLPGNRHHKGFSAFTRFTGMNLGGMKGHFRLLQYKMGPLNCVVRCLSHALHDPNGDTVEQIVGEAGEVDGHNSAAASDTPQKSKQTTKPEVPGLDSQPKQSVGKVMNEKSKSGPSVVETSLVPTAPLPRVTNAVSSETSTELSGTAPAYKTNASSQPSVVTSEPGPSRTVHAQDVTSALIPITKRSHPPNQASPSFKTDVGGSTTVVQSSDQIVVTDLRPSNHQAHGVQPREPLPGDQSSKMQGQENGRPRWQEKQRDATSTKKWEESKDAFVIQEKLVTIQTEDISDKEGPEDSPNMASMWLGRTSNLVHIGHANGYIESVEYRDLRRSLELWEKNWGTQINLRRLSSLLCHLYRGLHQRHKNVVIGGAFIAAFGLDAGGNAALRIFNGPEGFSRSPCPGNQIAEMWSEWVRSSGHRDGRS